MRPSDDELAEIRRILKDHPEFADYTLEDLEAYRGALLLELERERQRKLREVDAEIRRRESGYARKRRKKKG